MIKPYLLLLTTASILLSTFANASVETQLSQCAAVPDKLDRLVCYDNLSASLATKSVSSISVEPTTVAVATSAAVVTSTVDTQTSTIEEFGNLKKKEEQQVDTINLTVNKVTKDPYGALKIQFDNGQVWKQADSRSFKLKPEQKVYIEKAALGSFILGTKDRNTTIRVKRLK